MTRHPWTHHLIFLLWRPNSSMNPSLEHLVHFWNLDSWGDQLETRTQWKKMSYPCTIHPWWCVDGSQFTLAQGKHDYRTWTCGIMLDMVWVCHSNLFVAFVLSDTCSCSMQTLNFQHSLGFLPLFISFASNLDAQIVLFCEPKVHKPLFTFPCYNLWLSLHIHDNM